MSFSSIKRNVSLAAINNWEKKDNAFKFCDEDVIIFVLLLFKGVYLPLFLNNKDCIITHPEIPRRASTNYLYSISLINYKPSES